MAGITNLDDAIAKMTGANERDPLVFWKQDRVAGVLVSGVTQYPMSLWEFDGHPSGGVTPGAVSVPDNTTAGSLQQSDPGGGRQLWLTNASILGNSQITSLILYDRLLHVGGLSGTVTTAQTVGGSITRYTGTASYDNEAWIEISQSIGATPTTFTMSYTDEQGNAQTSPTEKIGGTNFQLNPRMIQMPTVGGTTGVRGVTSVTLAGTTGTAGSFAVVIMRPLLVIPCSTIGAGGIVDMIEATVEIQRGACLAMYAFTNGTMPRFYGQLSTVES